MILNFTTFYTRFFEKNLFERIILYLFASEIIVKIVFELVLGQWFFVQSQHKQWIFYALLALDYLISIRKVINIKLTVNVMSLFSLFFFILIAQGLFVGIMNGNKPFEILNDTIPPLMIALNILRFQSYEEVSKPIDFKFLLYATTSLAFLTCVIGFLAVKLGRPSVAQIPVGPVYFPLAAAGLIMVRPFPRILLPLIAIMFMLALPQFNRTTLAFIVLMMAGYSLIITLKDPSKGLFLIALFTILASVSWMLLPEDSQTYRRIMGLTELNFSARTGSVGERQEEFDSIRTTLAANGKTIELVGLGFGGVYEAQFTHKYVRNYGHAHYSWAWFNLRYGYSGYLYLLIFLSVLLFNAVKGLRMKTETGTFIGLLCIFGLLYCTTYVNAVFLCVGLHFFHLQQENQRT